MARRREIPVADLRGEALAPRPVPHSLGDAVDEAMEGLEEADREMLRMIFWERMTLTEAAKELGLADRRGAHYRVKRALAKLKEKLKEDGIDYGE